MTDPDLRHPSLRLSRGPVHLVAASQFLPDHDVTMRITQAGENISDYLTDTMDGEGCIHCELPEQRHGRVGRGKFLSRASPPT